MPCNSTTNPYTGVTTPIDKIKFMDWHLVSPQWQYDKHGDVQCYVSTQTNKGLLTTVGASLDEALDLLIAAIENVKGTDWRKNVQFLFEPHPTGD
jgi:hypothetical protein